MRVHWTNKTTSLENTIRAYSKETLLSIQSKMLSTNRFKNSLIEQGKSTKKFSWRKIEKLREDREAIWRAIWISYILNERKDLDLTPICNFSQFIYLSVILKKNNFLS